MTKVVYDTNVLLDFPDIVLEQPCAVSFETLRELDSLKRRPDLKFMAQAAIKSLKQALTVNNVEVLGAPTKESLDPESPDERIILDCLEAGYVFASQDVGANVIAEAVGLRTADKESESNYDKDYTGYIILEGDINYE